MSHLQDLQVDPIGFDVPRMNIYPTFRERYFQQKYYIDANNVKGEDHCVLVHSNRICIVTLAPSHPVISLQKTISNVNFQSGDKRNRLNNTVQGKRKHGAQCLEPMSILCVIECADGSKYSVRSCVFGKLIEVNEKLVGDPQLLEKKYNTDGYIAIILPNLIRNEKIKDELISVECYHEAVSARETAVKMEHT